MNETITTSTVHPTSVQLTDAIMKKAELQKNVKEKIRQNTIQQVLSDMYKHHSLLELLQAEGNNNIKKTAAEEKK